MAKLLIKTQGYNDQVLELKLGANRLGRHPTNDFQIIHPTVSGQHCVVTMGDGKLHVQDCDSTNGTFINDERITQGVLISGQTLRLGDVELFVESAEVTIAIPKFDMPRPAPPVVLPDGSTLCPRHPETKATHQCTHCSELMCEACVHKLRRRGGKLLKLCPRCSHLCVPLGGEKKRRKTFIEFLHMTVKLPFVKHSKAAKDE